jgi:glycine hydroxymethyltransferase
MAGAHPSPIDYAHFTTTSTYKPGGPRGGVILMGRDYEQMIETQGKEITLWRLLEKSTFPGIQGTPYLNNIAAKAIFFKETFSDGYRARQPKVIENAKRLAQNLLDLGYDVLTGGTDNHMVLVNVANLREGLTGVVAQNCLEDCGIVVNRNKLPYDPRPVSIASGVRLGTPIVTRNGMGEGEMGQVAELIDSVLRNARVESDSTYWMEGPLRDGVRKQVEQLCRRFPMR